MGITSEAIFSLKPVTFHYKGDQTNIPQFGLIAEEVAKVNPALILVDKEGKPYSVRYEQINAMLLNEFLKEHETVQELKSIVQRQQATIAQQQKSFQASLTEQEMQIKALASGLQKVRIQFTTASPPAGGVQVNRPAQQVVLNNP
jgi:predicted ribosome quality control (RQC) complex YloA/Tae2 family protein